MRLTKPITKEILKNAEEIIIYGAGNCGEIVMRGLEKWGYKVDFFCDQKEHLKTKWGVEVIRPAELPKHKNAVILLAALNFFYEMIENCETLGCENYYDIEEIMKLDIPDEELSYQAQDILANRARFLDVINHSPEENRLCIGKIELTVTEACTLNCRDCSYLMPHYKQPKNMDIETCINSIENLLKAVDRVSEFRLLGGEPFVNVEIYKIIEWLKQNSKISVIDIHTNGTIIPKENVIKSLQDEKVIIHISDYNVKTNKKEELIKLFKEKGIRFFVRKYDKWQDNGTMENKNYTEAEKQRVFFNCTSRNCYTLKGNKLFRCARSAHGMSVGFVPDMPSDYVILDDACKTTEELKQEIANLLFSKKAIQTCGYCCDLSKCKEIEAAIQL